MAGEQTRKVSDAAQQTVARVFGSENRARLLARYFNDAGVVNAANAWQHIYRLLLWIDKTTALAHCYESDKAQPGRPWYARSLAFHDWVSKSLEVSPSDLGENIDWLFREAIKDLASKALAIRTELYEEQRAPYKGRGFPEPGEDSELVSIVKEALGKWMSQEPPDDAYRTLTRRLYVYMTQENKRRNLVGEGFEDVVAAVVERLPLSGNFRIHARTLLHDLPGFNPPARNEKSKKVDLALIRGNERILVSAKWSIRADREEQFQSDFESYARLEAAGRDFEYTLITNEFDAARLKAACERRKQNATLFTNVVHINPTAVLAAYGNAKQGAVSDVRVHIERGRLLSLGRWLALVEDRKPSTKASKK